MTKRKDPKDKLKAGAKTKYDEIFNEQVEKLCKLGATDSDIARFFNVTETTINNWKIDFPIFFESLRRGKDIFDTDLIETALKNRAKGMVLKETRVTVNSGDDDDKDPYVSTTTTTKEIAPDTTAMIYWLKNRDQSRWRDKQELEVNDLSIANITVDFTEDDDDGKQEGD